MGSATQQKPIDAETVQLFSVALKKNYEQKIAAHFGPDRVHQFLNIIWPAHDRANPDWHYIGRRLLDMSFFMYWIDGPDEIQAELVFLANVAYLRECMK